MKWNESQKSNHKFHMKFVSFKKWICLNLLAGSVVWPVNQLDIFLFYSGSFLNKWFWMALNFFNAFLVCHLLLSLPLAPDFHPCHFMFLCQFVFFFSLLRRIFWIQFQQRKERKKRRTEEKKKIQIENKRPTKTKAIWIFIDFKKIATSPDSVVLHFFYSFPDSICVLRRKKNNRKTSHHAYVFCARESEPMRGRNMET